MNVHLAYSSGQSYSQHFSNFQVTISHKNSKRVTFSFREKTGEAYASLSLPVDKARQLGHAILTAAAADDVNPIEFAVNEPVRAQSAA
jgi:hypothetical protein